MQKCVLMYGNAANFHDGWGGCSHMEWIKDNGLSIQRQASKFNEQIGEHICEGVVLNMAEDTMTMELTDQMHLLPHHLITKFNKMTRNDYDEVSLSTYTAIVNVTVAVEKKLDEDRLDDPFVSHHTFSNKMACNYNHNEKQEL